MISWLVSLIAGLGASLWLYGWRLPADGYRRALVALRALAVALLVALVLDAPLGARVAARAIVALDVSSSWRQGGTDAFDKAVTSARARSGELLVFGDSLRGGSGTLAPSDLASRIAPAVDRAAALGRPLHVVSDGQFDDPEALEALPAGSSIDVIPMPDIVDVAVRSVEAPHSASPGDSVEVRALVSSAGRAVPSATIALRLADGSALAAASLGALSPWSEREWRVRVKLPDRRDALAVRVVVTAPGDAQARNDTLTTVLELRAAPAAVLVSTAPDQDARFALAIMRGALGFGVRAYLRVAANNWREEGSLARVEERTVREAIARAPVVVLHGDTAYFGAPRSATRGALALVPPPADDDGEYFTDRAGASPLAPALSGVPWDSLPPITVGPSPVGTSWSALSARRARRFDDRVVIAGYDAPRRVAVLPVRGLWRWQFRGGRSADAFAAVWGGVFDWLAAERVDDRPVALEAPWYREGEPLVWHRGVSKDSTVQVRLRRDGSPADTTLTLRFGASSESVTTPPLPAGLWRATATGSSTAFAVNASAEWIPRRPVASRTAVGGAPSPGVRPTLRNGWWWYALLLALLSAEWWMRRRIGLR